jgi:putative flippase GtrA
MNPPTKIQKPHRGTKSKLAREVVTFSIIGVINTILGLAVMLGLYNLLHTGYWISSAISYVVGSIVSYVLNKKYTFRYTGDTVGTLMKFAINIAVCYIIAYSLAKPLMIFVLSSFDLNIRIVEQIAMIFGMCIFTSLNFIGQKFFTFRKHKYK